MTLEQLIDYWSRMDHSRERVPVRGDQLADFIHGVYDPDQGLKLEIEPDGATFYIRLGG